MAAFSLSALLLLLLPFPSLAQIVHSLSTFEWTLSNPPLNISVPASFPSHAHLDLFAAQVIGDPYFGLNDFNLRWVAWSNWTYSAVLNGLNPSSEGSLSTYLLFHGLDTFTSIDLCGHHVAATNNQFRQYFFDVSDILKRCADDEEEPVLKIDFGSAPNIVDRIANEPGQETWPFGVQQLYEFPNRWFMRKEQSDFGWDWGPAFAPAGPWLPGHVIQLAPSEIHTRNTLIDAYRQGQRNNMIPDQTKPWVFNVSIDYLGTLPHDATLAYTIKDSRDQMVTHGQLNDITMREGVISGNTIIEDGSVDLWWPNGLGPQTLYTVTLDVNKGTTSLATATKRMGFRTIVLNEEVVSKEDIAKGVAPGNNWHFEINGHEFFAKGSNFIPPDAFWPRVTPDRIRQLFESVVVSHQNMLRVWGSGAYAPDFLYDIADEMGLLLWCEFEFGDALYPVHQEFLNNVYEEANFQVRRVNHHPSLAYWAGGNELENLELALLNESAPGEYLRYKDQYEKIFLSTLFPAVFENSRSISYAPSSTSNGFVSLNFTEAPYFQERYENLKEGSIYGEIDYYNYDSSVAFNFADYPVGRFANEFGFHSMPSLQTWQQAISPRDLHFNSSVIQLRNHHFPPGGLSTSNFANSSIGMGEMTMAAQQWYPTPLKPHDTVANFSAWCWTTQVFQADYYATQIQFYRRGSGLPQRTLGSLYWQLEDIWQAPAWSSIEFDGRWKVLHYRAADVHRNVIVSPFWDTNRAHFSVWVTSDLWEDVQGTVDLAWYDWSGRLLTHVPGLAGASVRVGAINSTMVFSGDVATLLGGVHVNDAMAWLRVNVTGRLPNTHETRSFTHENWWHAAPLSAANIVDPGLALSYDEVSRRFVVEATSGVAAWVWLDYPRGAVIEFTENGFWLLKGARKMVGYRVKSDITGGAWVAGVTVQSLWNNTLPH